MAHPYAAQHGSMSNSNNAQMVFIHDDGATAAPRQDQNQVIPPYCRFHPNAAQYRSMLNLNNPQVAGIPGDKAPRQDQNQALPPHHRPFPNRPDQDEIRSILEDAHVPHGRSTRFSTFWDAAMIRHRLALRVCSALHNDGVALTRKYNDLKINYSNLQDSQTTMLPRMSSS